MLVTEDGIGKLADFGVSARLATSAQRQQSIVGSPYWMAPEVITAPKARNRDLHFSQKKAVTVIVPMCGH